MDTLGSGVRHGRTRDNNRKNFQHSGSVAERDSAFEAVLYAGHETASSSVVLATRRLRQDRRVCH